MHRASGRRWQIDDGADGGGIKFFKRVNDQEGKPGRAYTQIKHLLRDGFFRDDPGSGPVGQGKFVFAASAYFGAAGSSS